MEPCFSPTAEAAIAFCSPEVINEKADDPVDEPPIAPTPEQLEIRLKNLLDTCTYVVYNYTRRGLFDRDKLIVLTLLTFQILLNVSPCHSPFQRTNKLWR